MQHGNAADFSGATSLQGGTDGQDAAAAVSACEIMDASFYRRTVASRLTGPTTRPSMRAVPNW
jgi:hypothetical protein